MTTIWAFVSKITFESSSLLTHQLRASLKLSLASTILGSRQQSIYTTIGSSMKISFPPNHIQNLPCMFKSSKNSHRISSVIMLRCGQGIMLLVAVIFKKMAIGGFCSPPSLGYMCLSNLILLNLYHSMIPYPLFTVYYTYMPLFSGFHAHTSLLLRSLGLMLWSFSVNPFDNKHYDTTKRKNNNKNQISHQTWQKNTIGLLKNVLDHWTF